MKLSILFASFICALLLNPVPALGNTPVQEFDYKGVILTGSLNFALTSAGSEDTLPVLVSPSRYEYHEASSLEPGAQFGFEVGYGLNRDWRITGDARITLFHKGKHADAHLNIIVSYRLFNELSFRLGVGIEYLNTEIEVDTKKTAGPDNTIPITQSQELEGTNLTAMAGLDYQIGLTRRIALAITMDGVFSLIKLSDEPDILYDDDRGFGLHLGVAIRFFL